LESTTRAACSTRRLGAYGTALVLALVVAGALRRGQSNAAKLAAVSLGVAVVLQWLIGMNLIWKGWPLWLGTAHNAGAALLVLASVALLRALSPRSEVGRYRPTLR
jgi:heme a synthase